MFLYHWAYDNQWPIVLSNPFNIVYLFISLSEADIGKVHKGCSPSIIILIDGLCSHASGAVGTCPVQHILLFFQCVASRVCFFWGENCGLRPLHWLTVDSHEHSLHLFGISGLNWSESKFWIQKLHMVTWQKYAYFVVIFE